MRRLLAERDLRGAEFCRAYSKRVDDWLVELFEVAGGEKRAAALVAVGGYGRSELSPHSDIDVLLLHEQGEDVEELAIGLWHPIWDEGLKLGHAVRSVNETLKLAGCSLEIATSLLSLRHLAGDAEMSRCLADGAERQWKDQAEKWLPSLVADSFSRAWRYGSVAFRLQPDLKESKGGLRDIQALRFAMRAHPDLLGSSTMLPSGPYETILAARVELHRATRNSRNLLALEYQEEVSEALGYRDVTSFMTALSAAGRTAAWVVDNAWSKIKRFTDSREASTSEKASQLSPGVVLFHNEIVLSDELSLKDPLELLRIAVAAAENDARIEHESLLALADCPPLGERWPLGGRELFVRLLATGRRAIPVIESLDQVGAMVKILPEWEICRGLLQRNDYHRFTVDRHLCETAAEAAKILNRGDAIDRRDLLLIVAFLHDIGKGVPGNHCTTGMLLVDSIAARMGFDAADRATLVKLVRLHLLLPDVATRRHIESVGTILRVAAEVGDVSTLHLLAALTEADSIATGPSVWSSWKATLIRGLVRRVEHYLLGGELGELPRSFPTPEVLERMADRKILLEAEGRQIMAIVPKDPYLLPTLAGVITLNGLSVISAVGYSNDGMTAQLLLVDAPGPDSAVWRKVLADVRAALDGKLALDERLSRLTRTSWTSPERISAPQPIVGPFVKFDNDVSASSTVLELSAPDSMGLLYRITSALVGAGLRIKRARVQTLGDQVVDSFDVIDADGGKITDESRLGEIEELVVPVIRDAYGHQRVRREDSTQTPVKSKHDDDSIFGFPVTLRET